MKKLLKVAAAATLLVSFAPSISAQEITSTKVVAAEVGQELPTLEKLEILREVAVENGIPAEILKAMALAEGNGMRQFNDDGTPFVSGDKGIGVMQITFSDEEYKSYNVDKERVMYDTRYNIEQGALHLLRKWNNSNLPLVNNHEKDKIEDWYFAIMAYNGLSKTNDPKTVDGKHYQETVFDYIRQYSQLPIGKTPTLDIRYDASKPGIMFFPEGKHYTWPTSTKTTQNYKVGDIAYTYTEGNAANLRNTVGGTVTAKIPNYIPFEIVSGPHQSKNQSNHFVFYEVKGKYFNGFMASSNLVSSKTVNVFNDVPQELQTIVTFLQSRDIIDGYSATKFEPNINVTRGQATKLIVEALVLKLPTSDYKLTATDVSPSHPFYEYMRIADANGILKGVGGEFLPDNTLTRSEMAIILERAFRTYLDNPPASYKYSGLNTTAPNYAIINKLAFNGITNAKDFNSNGTLSRGDFARFLERSVKKMN